MGLLKKLNEAFEKMYHKEDKLEEDAKHFDLLMSLKRARETLEAAGEHNLKAYEVAYQDVIEDYFPDKAWWEVVDFNIFEHLFNEKDPEKTEIEIVKHIKDDVTESVEEVEETEEEEIFEGCHKEDKLEEVEEECDREDHKEEELKEEFEKGFEFDNSGMKCEVLDTNGEYTLIHIKNKKFQPYVVAWLLSKNRNDDEYSWSQGHYFMNREDAEEFLRSKDEEIEESIDVDMHIDREGNYISDDDIEVTRNAFEEAKERGIDPTLENLVEIIRYFGLEADEESVQIVLNYMKDNNLTEGCHSKHIQKIKKPVKESIKTFEEIDLEDFDFWGPAEERFSLLTDDEKATAQEYIEEMFADGIGKTELNDLFAYDDDFICMICDIEDDEELYDRRK